MNIQQICNSQNSRVQKEKNDPIGFVGRNVSTWIAPEEGGRIAPERWPIRVRVAALGVEEK